MSSWYSGSSAAAYTTAALSSTMTSPQSSAATAAAAIDASMVPSQYTFLPWGFRSNSRNSSMTGAVARKGASWLTNLCQERMSVSDGSAGMLKFLIADSRSSVGL
ncbi:hypothetical protein E2C01_069695 [Portunus trituberculatus]|uniref:Uncharacterized protein n=1 Tax=Portunus trituberculatus TaxID=210409 RepID=A0A5B7I099_PORTR|nr:hypothetical protein [Portunus trituberculatus]